MAIKQLKRVFVLEQAGKDNISLPDPNPSYTPEEVLDHYSIQYPELNNSVAVPDKENADEYIYKIKTTMGTKG